MKRISASSLRAARCTGQQADQRAATRPTATARKAPDKGAPSHAPRGPEITPQRIRAQPVREAGLQQLLVGLADDGRFSVMGKPARNQGPQRGRGNHHQGQGQRGRQASEPCRSIGTGPGFATGADGGRQPGATGRGDAGCSGLEWRSRRRCSCPVLHRMT